MKVRTTISIQARQFLLILPYFFFPCPLPRFLNFVSFSSSLFPSFVLRPFSFLLFSFFSSFYFRFSAPFSSFGPYFSRPFFFPVSHFSSKFLLSFTPCILPCFLSSPYRPCRPLLVLFGLKALLINLFIYVSPQATHYTFQLYVGTRLCSF